LILLIESTTSIVHHFALFHTLEEEKKKADALVDILIKLVEKNPDKLHCMVVPSTVALNQAQQRSHAPLLASTLLHAPLLESTL
jgi:hypothetical protein